MDNFDTVYKNNYPVMFCVAQKMINDRDSAHDIIHDVFMYYYQKSNNGYEIINVKSWLIRATINKCVDFSNNRKKFIKIDSINPIGNPDNKIENDQNSKIIHQALSMLKPKEKIIALLYSEGLSYKEISEVTNINFTSIGKTLSRTLNKLNDILKNMNYEMH